MKKTVIMNRLPPPDFKYPYYIYIEFTTESEKIKDYEWGGALISKKHVLTSAHGFYPVGNEESLT